MEFPQRFVVVIMGFFGLLCTYSLRTCFSLVMVHVLRRNLSSTNSIFKECTINGTSKDLHLPWNPSNTQFFNSAFFIGYFITQLPGGYLAARFSSSRVFGVSILFSGLMVIILSFVIQYGPAVVFAIRLIQGLFEGMSIPAMNGVLSAWSLSTEKSRMVTLTYAGVYLSPAVAFFTTGVTTCYVSWNSSFYIFGGLVIVFALLWMCLIYDNPNSNPNLSEKERILFERDGRNKSSKDAVKNVPYRKILTSLPVTAVVVGNFCRNWIFSMQVSQLPQYFADAYGMNVASIGFLVSLPDIMMVVVVVAGGIFIDKIITSGKVSTTVGRKIAQCSGFGIEALCVLSLVFIRDFRVAIVVLIIGIGISGMAMSGYMVNILDLAPQYAHIATGFIRISCIGSVLSTALAGSLREGNVESWQRIFLIAGIIHLLGVIYYGIFASGERQSWAETTDMTSSDSTVALASCPVVEYGTVSQDNDAGLVSNSGGRGE